MKNTVFVTNENNDLIKALKYSGHAPKTEEDVLKAVSLLEENGKLFILASEYPEKATVLTEETLSLAKERNIKIYIEYPERISESTTDAPEGIVYERLIALKDIGTLKKHSLLMANGCRYRKYFNDAQDALLVLGKVAGYDTLEYEIPEKSTVILKYLDKSNTVLIATTALSSFITPRNVPKHSWIALWQGIFKLMGIDVSNFDYKESVYLTADKTEALKEDAAENAWNKNIKWIKEYMLDLTYPTPMVVEGFASSIDENGKQTARRVFRGDCTGEVAMELCLGGYVNNDNSLTELSFSVMETLFTPKLFYNDDPRSSCYGHINWYENARIFYGDDNARALLGALSVRAVSGNTKWDEQILRAVFANLRTSDKYGIRCPRLDINSFKESTWLDYYNGTMEYVSPHYQAYLYAVFLWAYQLTGIKELYHKSVSAIEKTMALFPHKLRWQNSLTGEITRMLLPLSILVRIAPSEKHVKWLEAAVDATIKLQEPCGAVREIFSDMALGKYPPPSSNESYGTTEASLIQNNGDPATDLLYALNWAFIGLWEAYLALKAPKIKEAYLKLKDLLLRIQLRSKLHPELDGAWMRSFDFNKWEYWGSASDIGWSAWSVESGWTNAWIAATLMLESKNESLFNLSHSESIKSIASEIYKEMMTFVPTVETDGEVKKMEGSAE